MGDQGERGFVCPRCRGSKIDVFYTGPLTFECAACGIELIDENDEGIPVRSMEYARRKYPGMYGGEICDKCSHGPHEGECRTVCEFCMPPPPHVYKFRVGRSIRV